jgi:hypothetical protein
MVELVPMGSTQTAKFEWVSPQGVVTHVDMQLIEDQLERFADSPGHMLHAKIVGAIIKLEVIVSCHRKIRSDCQLPS